MNVQLTRHETRESGWQKAVWLVRHNDATLGSVEVSKAPSGQMFGQANVFYSKNQQWFWGIRETANTENTKAFVTGLAKQVWETHVGQ